MDALCLCCYYRLEILPVKLWSSCTQVGLILFALNAKGRGQICLLSLLFVAVMLMLYQILF